MDLRTAFGFALEPEMYDLTVRDASLAHRHAGSRRTRVALLGLDTCELRPAGAHGRQAPASVTFRVPPGTYSAGAISFGLAGDEAHEGIVALRAARST